MEFVKQKFTHISQQKTIREQMHKPLRSEDDINPTKEGIILPLSLSLPLSLMLHSRSRSFSFLIDYFNKKKK
jgi:hypothetical protein